MRTVSTRRTTIRRVGLAALLVGAVLVLSGCWGSVRNDPSFPWKFLTVKKGIGEAVIWNCTVEHGTGSGRGYCVLDNIRALCDGRPLPGLTNHECHGITSHNHVVQMIEAIEDVISSDPNRQLECLQAGVYKADPYSGLSSWDGINLGEGQCRA